MPKSKPSQASEIQETIEQKITEPEKEKRSKKEKKKAKENTRGPLCKLVKSGFMDEHFSEYQDLVNPPAYICKKCGRAAADKKSLCKPVRIG
jgi:hypothetical protein